MHSFLPFFYKEEINEENSNNDNNYCFLRRYSESICNGNKQNIVKTEVWQKKCLSEKPIRNS